jgi:hypothetical protein
VKKDSVLKLAENRDAYLSRQLVGHDDLPSPRRDTMVAQSTARLRALAAELTNRLAATPTSRAGAPVARPVGRAGGGAGGAPAAPPTSPGDRQLGFGFDAADASRAAYCAAPVRGRQLAASGVRPGAS